MFYPGREWGEEFVYPKVRAAELAKAASVPVLSTPVIPEEEAMPDAPEIVAQLEHAPVTAMEPSGIEIPTSEVVRPPDAKYEPPKVLPDTGSMLPLMALAGLLAIGCGFGVRFAAKRLG
jgi:LPXTG-motif cell wall-anchored protein